MTEFMKYKINIKILAILGLLVIVTVAWHFGMGSGRSPIEESFVASDFQGPCRSTIDSRSLIHQLSSNGTEAYEAASKLIALANESHECREQIINELVQEMKKGLVEYNQSSFQLWAKGSSILGELKAVETLDLLIDNLNLSDGLFSASMTHQPVVLAVEKMGVLAVPKLAAALENHTNRNIRLAAALCLFDIGGSEALDTLKSALSSETDRCVRRFITLSLPDSAPKSKKRVTAEDSEVLRQRLQAFRCGN